MKSYFLFFRIFFVYVDILFTIEFINVSIVNQQLCETFKDNISRIYNI